MASHTKQPPIADKLYDNMRGTGYEQRAKKCFVIRMDKPSYRKSILVFKIKCKPKTGSMRTHTVYMAYQNPKIPFGKQPLGFYCTCESWRYQGTAYIATKKGYNLFYHTRENRFPEIRDPHLQNFLCKHIIHILKYLKNKRPISLSIVKKDNDIIRNIKPKNKPRGKK